MTCVLKSNELFSGVERCDAMTSALEALSGVSVASASGDALELKLTTDVACDHLGESGCYLCTQCCLHGNALVQCMHSLLDCTYFTAILLRAVADIHSVGISLVLCSWLCIPTTLQTGAHNVQNLWFVQGHSVNSHMLQDHLLGPSTILSCYNLMR